MSFTDSVSSALRAIASNKLRSFLTMLGVVIGVGSVIAMIGIGEGTKRKALENIQLMGTNMLTVMPNWRRGGQGGGGDTPTLKMEDVEDLKRSVPTLQHITASVRQGAPIKFGSRTHNTQVMGGRPEQAIIRNATKMHQGTWYTEEDEALANRVCVLGYQVYDELFAGENAVGATVRIKGRNFTVLGVVAYKGGGGFMNPDDQVYVPLQTAMKRLMGKNKPDMIVMQASHADLMPYTQYLVESTLARKRRNASGEELFRVMNQAEWIEQMETQTRLLGILLAGIASVSLLVGGIGIMNIMLVSVTERTREIGLRKAIGAKRSSILSQFLLESVVMCTVGGVIGIAVGVLGIVPVSATMQVPPTVHPEAIILAFGFSAMIGLFFGLYPALRASRLQPIEALRYE
ncbi:MAG TPA: ABC transporter permease [Fimbriimonadaceae bacterium]|nr:ABC transporter permease [Fimbriimonadaceae bacterium]